MEPVGSPGSRVRGGSYSVEEVERGLLAVARCAGNTRRASRELAAHGLEISFQTLHRWVTCDHAHRYEHVRHEVMPQVYSKIAVEAEDLARQYAEAERETLEKFRRELPDLKVGEVAGALRNLATSRGISTDKANVLRNRPTQIVEQRSASEILRRLAEIGVIDGTAEELRQLPGADE